MADDGPVLLCDELHLHLRHVAKVTVAVLLPEMKGVSVSISNWEIMEKLKALAAPEVFSQLRVGKTTRQILYFEGELPSLRALRKAIVQLHGKAIKLGGLTQQLRVKAGESELHFPTKKDWESYFQDRGVPSFDEGLPGDRCDTICIQGIPTMWMIPAGSRLPNLTSTSKVRDKVERHDMLTKMLSKSFGKFGKVKRVDVIENGAELASGNFSSFGPSTTPQSTFVGYVQYEDYASFCSAMAGLRGMKLVQRVKGEPELAVPLAVNFDKSSHMSDRCVRKRRKDLDRLYEIELEAKEKAQATAAAEKQKREEKLLQERKQREEEERKRREKAAAEAERQRLEKERRRQAEKEQRREERQKRRAEKEAARVQREAEKEALRLQREAEKEAERERQLLLQQRRREADQLLKQILLMAAAQHQVDMRKEQEEEARKEQVRREELLRKEREEREELERKRKAAEEAAKRAEADMVLKQRDSLMEQVKSMEDRRLELQRSLLRRKLASERALLQATQAAKR
ncbi:A-kinase anchor protein 17A-like [Sycon ciliatum]|uniref:A-kinase anchor protein 17A-like n=1 Tax=Sycon ciliatum TaxID=27933 RepID=UPI0020A8CA40|eukprot:scpid50550/ scgid15171/ A-kinase anchor protein 17A; 721P; B-lymphocyte antigen; Protein XE7; Protein kinase A-anchoring protein 17A; Splicing factor, arginine/serine-rich 17A